MDREIKLFLSSTFDKKMRKRRDYFKNEINAHLNKIVGQVGTNLFLYDYEVGIPENTPFTIVLDTCFQKIDRSKYFVAILDNNYGTHINKTFKEKQETYSGKYEALVTQGMQEDLSVLELEIIRALERENENKIKTFLFIRRDVQNRSPELKNLIQDIKTNAPRENVKDFSDDSEILTFLEKHFNAEINDELEQYTKEQRNHNLMYANKMRYYVEDNTTLNVLDDYIAGDCDKVLVLNGKSGSGKSTLLLNWIEKLRSDAEKNVISCFADIDGNTVSDVFRKLNNQDSKVQIEKIDDKKDEIYILDSFIPFTHNLSGNHKKNIIVLDGLDQINFTNERKGEAAKYYWLNETLPPNVKVIISTTDKKVDKNKFQIHSITPNSLPKIVKRHLEKEGKELLYPDFEKFIDFKNKKIDNIPVIARLICSEICMSADFANLPKFLTTYNEQLLSETSIIDLYKGFLERIAKRNSISILPEICRYLYCSEGGLDANTLYELFALQGENKEEQIEHFNTLLYHDLRINVDGRMVFSHSYFKQAVEKLYVGNNQDIRNYRNDIISILEKKGFTEQTLPECAFQIKMLRNKDKMFELLSDIDNAKKLYEINLIRFLEYVKLANDSDGLLEIFEKTHSGKHIVFLAQLFHEIAYYEKALAFYKKTEKNRKKIQGNEHLNLANIYNNIGIVYYRQGNYKKAIEFCKEAIKISEKALEKDHPDIAKIYNSMGLVYFRQGEYEKALEFHQKALIIVEKAFGKEHIYPAITHSNIAEVYIDKGDYSKALIFHQKALKIIEKMLGKAHPDTAMIYNNIAVVYSSRGCYFKNQDDFLKALEYSKKALKIQEKVLGNKHPDTANTYNNIGLVYDEQGNCLKALRFYNKALKIREKVLGKGHPHTVITYDSIATVLSQQGDYPKAVELYKKALKIIQKALGKDHPDTAIIYNNMALIHYYQENYPEALYLFRKAVIIWGNVFGFEHPMTKTGLKNMFLAFEETNNFQSFEEWFNMEVKNKLIEQTS